MNIIIRKMDISDLNSISDILEIDFDNFWNYNVFKSELENSSSTYFVALINNEIVGFGGIWKCSDEFHITNIVVKKNKRNLHIGSKILEKLIEVSKNENATSMTLEVNKNNIPAIKLYSKYNFLNVGLRKNYYNGTDDAIIMTLSF